MLDMNGRMSPAKGKAATAAAAAAAAPAEEDEACVMGDTKHVVAAAADDDDGVGVGVSLPCAEPTVSPWLREPSERLMGMRSTEQLPATADVVVVGSGITGAFAAHFLKAGWARGKSVVMLEAREACWGASARTTGIFEPTLFHNSLNVAAFELENFRLVRDIVRVAGAPCDWRDIVSLYVSSEPFFTLGRNLIADINEQCPEIGGVIELLDLSRGGKARDGDGGGGQDDDDEDEEGVGGTAVAAVATEPQSSSSSSSSSSSGGGIKRTDEKAARMAHLKRRLATLGVADADGAIVLANAATINPYKLVAWILERLVAEFPADKFALHTNTPVTSLTRGRGGPAGGGGREDTGDDDDGGDDSDTGWWTLATPRGSIRARRVLLATNGYTAALLPEFADLIVPVRRQAATVVTPPATPTELTAKAAMEAAKASSSEPGVGGGGGVWAINMLSPDGLNNDYILQRPSRTRHRRPRSGKQQPVEACDDAGELVVDGGRHLAPDMGVGEWRDDGVDREVASYLRGLIRRTVDAQAAAATDGSSSGAGADDGAGKEGGPEIRCLDWTGIAGHSRDRDPWVGQVPEALGGGEGLYVCAAYSGHGMTTAPLCARWVVRDMKPAPTRAGGGEEKDDDEGEATRGRSGSHRRDKDEDDETPVSRMPARFRTTHPGRLQHTREEWPDVLTMEEGGVDLFFRTIVGQLVLKRHAWSHELTVHDSLWTVDQKLAAQGGVW